MQPMVYYLNITKVNLVIFKDWGRTAQKTPSFPDAKTNHLILQSDILAACSQDRKNTQIYYTDIQIVGTWNNLKDVRGQPKVTWIKTHTLCPRVYKNTVF
jgi:hypothetical protein